MKVDLFVSEVYGNGEFERIIGCFIKEGMFEENKVRFYIMIKCMFIVIINVLEFLVNIFCICSFFFFY